MPDPGLLRIVLLIVAALLAILEAFGITSPRFRTGWGGVALLALGEVLQ